jgi:lysophospholipase L1-like esterase
MHDIALQTGQKFVLIGDSITDFFRNEINVPYGTGYVSILRDLVIAGWPERDITWVNKGISGNTVLDLAARWQEDVIAENPDWLSIKIGINDLWRRLDGQGVGVLPEQFRQVYTELLTLATTRIHPQIILITPFYMHTDTAGESMEAQMLRMVSDYIGIVEELAAKFNTHLIRLQPLFQKHMQLRSPRTFGDEPVHPNHTGHVIIAKEILKVLMK